MHPLVSRVAETIRQYQLIRQGQGLILIALSGGTDSVALLRVLLLLGYEVVGLHCNFHLRGAESDEDEAAVRRLAEQLGFSLEVAHFDTRAYARQRGISIEMAARELRYRWFAEIRMQRYSGAPIAVAHHADDALETQLLNLSMGTGLRGLSGMPYARQDGVIRPMMQAHRSEIEAFVAAEGLPARHDSSNNDLSFKRNYIRHRIIPAFEQLNPSFRSSALSTLEHLRGAEALYRYAVEHLRGEIECPEGLRLEPLIASPDPETMLYELLQPYGFDGPMCQLIASNLANPQPGRRYRCEAYELIEGRHLLELLSRERSQWSEQPLDLTREGALETPLGRLSWWLEDRSSVKDLRVPPREALMDAELLLSRGRRTTLRGRKEGDRLYPYGMPGSKLLRRIFIDSGMSHREREEALLLCLEDEPIWLVGRLADRRYGIGEGTRSVLHLRLEEDDRG